MHAHRQWCHSRSKRKAASTIEHHPVELCWRHFKGGALLHYWHSLPIRQLQGGATCVRNPILTGSSDAHGKLIDNQQRNLFHLVRFVWDVFRHLSKTRPILSVVRDCIKPFPFIFLISYCTFLYFPASHPCSTFSLGIWESKTEADSLEKERKKPRPTQIALTIISVWLAPDKLDWMVRKTSYINPIRLWSVAAGLRRAHLCCTADRDAHRRDREPSSGANARFNSMESPPRCFQWLSDWPLQRHNHCYSSEIPTKPSFSFFCSWASRQSIQIIWIPHETKCSRFNPYSMSHILDLISDCTLFSLPRSLSLSRSGMGRIE